MALPATSRVCARSSTVQRGCSYYCTFCIVPHVRGRFDHRPQEAIARGSARSHRGRRARNHARRPNRQRVARPGDRRRLRRSLRGRYRSCPGLERLTFISPHPKDFTAKILDDLAALDALNPRIHLPLQSGSDAMLRRMNRKYTRRSLSRKGRADSRTLRGVRDHDRYHRRISRARPRTTFEATLGYVKSGRVRQCVYFHLFDAPGNARRALGASAARGRTRPLRAPARCAESHHARLSRP